MKEYRVLTFDSKDLNRQVKILIYLPKTYEKNDRFYPVLYMHDGQNLFDEDMAYKTSWNILDHMEDDDMPELIIVGINSTKSRADELLPMSFTFEGEEIGGQADQYYKFIKDELKPMIDLRYRTFKSPKYTAIMGSSFGGVSSLYAALKYNNVFSRFGCMSNAHYVLGQTFLDMVKEDDFDRVRKIYMDVGTEETSGSSISKEEYVKSNQDLYDILKEKMLKEDLQFHIVKDAKHEEEAWSKRFKDVVKFLFEA